ncbi:MAG: bifunctional adenosylcobinamide kinase/adenosylcobinamide-phosphate guanylyltransferase [Caldimicrobium sp.]|nr:bifunctional adenosylcobinamide kinase/adenosylcobinamide-phosphate guanylyltransferase [Caldimicrobium sp.]MCX7874318.1 bifunctional adenosylcobinamide kinase/adenosylcobinamide-phosphate guanylyltransferase [Caldimicrobium sp.]MDW8094924.1 bifunctional adenosylcobinamide kinase/adenosylcobinamide-phosphate guanylyltransferase [Caldimicrobium sp.]
MLTFVLGGARSGKTKWALRYGESLNHFSKYYYIATAEPLDEEMKERILIHKKERSSQWETIEESLDISSLLNKLNYEGNLILVDCLTLWLSNVFLKDVIKTNHWVENLLQSLVKYKGTEKTWVILVSNEVGLGIVPENPLGRVFRDQLGLLNQRVADLADEFFFIIAGKAISLKGKGLGTP